MVTSSAAIAADAVSDSDVYTLFRDSVFQDVAPIHIATFDARDGRDYNRENCMIARDLFQHQEGVRVNYWCQPGHAR